jgi:hypothetical protein
MSAARKTDSSGSSSVTDASTPGDGIHKCDTVPPPAGEDSAYDAPTKVGELGLVQQLMAQAEGMRFDTAPPPKSGERPLTTPKPKAIASEPPVVEVIPPPAAIPRIYDASDDGDESNAGQPQQSGATKLLDVSAGTSTAVASSSPPIGSQSIAAQLDAYRASSRPAKGASDAKLVFVACALVTLGLAALYFFFLAA